MKQETRIWLQAQRNELYQEPVRPRRSLCVQGHVVGSLDELLVQQLEGEALATHGLQLQWSEGQWLLLGEGTASEKLNRLALALRQAGLAGAWRNEQLAVYNSSDQVVATVERGAVRPLGIATRAVHLVGFSPDGLIWVQQRASNKSNNPDMWDTLMGGMVSAADSLPDALARETWEEAGLHVHALQDLRHGGYVDFSRPSDEAEGQGYMRERIDWFAATVPAAMKPRNQDGEVQRFELLTLDVLEEWLVQGRFTQEAAMVLAACMGW